jgi:hypothetical protein
MQTCGPGASEGSECVISSNWAHVTNGVCVTDRFWGDRRRHAAQAPRNANPIAGNWATKSLINRNLGASLTRVRQALDTVVNYFANRLEEFNPRIRQVLSHCGRKVKAFV